jgi:hypothetical protein
MAGGLRGWHDLKTTVIRKHSSKLLKVCFTASKKDDAIENPVNPYVLEVYKRNGTLPFIDNEQKYSALIRANVKFINFDREIKPDKYVNKYERISYLFGHGFLPEKRLAKSCTRM